MAEFPVNDEDIKALRVKLLRALAASTYPKEAIGPIAANNKLTVGDVKSLVDPYGFPDKVEMARHVLELTGEAVAAPAAPSAARPPQRPPAERAPGGPLVPSQTLALDQAPPTVQVVPDQRVETLLNAASKSEKARTRRLGVRIHELIAELRGLVNSETAEREAAAKAAAEQAKLQAEVKQLEEQLAAKKAALSGKPKSTASALPAPPKDIRAWAAANGVDCPAFGRLPGGVVAAYTAAKGAA